MTTLLDIATRALRAQGVIDAGQVPAGQDAADALQHLQDTINDLPLLRAGEWTEVTLTDATTYAASDGERVNAGSTGATITLPTTYTDENGVSQTTLDLSRVQIIGGTQAGLWVYAASLGEWAQVDDLALNDDSPFGPEDDAGLVALMAVSMVSEYGGEVSAVVTARAQRAMSSFRARFYREVVVPGDDALILMSNIGRQGLTGLTP